MSDYQFLVHDEQYPHQPLTYAAGTLAEPKAGQVLLKVEAAGINRADLMQREGLYPPPPGASSVLGLEVAGTVVKTDASERWPIGSAVMALLPGGGYASYALAEATELMPAPPGYTWAQAAAVPEAFLTAYQALFVEGHVKAGQSVLIHGGAGGVGSAAIQLAVSAGMNVIATAGSEAKCAVIRKLGATAINYQQDDIAATLEQLTSGNGVNFILDPIAGENYTELHLQCAAMDAEILVLSFLDGRYGHLDYAKLLSKRLTLKGSTLRNRSLAYRSQLIADFQTDFAAALHEGEIAPLLDSNTYTWDEADLAHQRMLDSSHIGKLVLEGTWPDIDK